MPRMRIPAGSRRRLSAEFQNRCAYCRAPTIITGAQLVIDHIQPQASGAETVWENLCVACHSCNEFKSAQVRAVDPRRGKRVRLFHPRRQQWRDHFRWSEDGSEIIGVSSAGRATVAALKMNHPFIVEARRRWALVGWHPPTER